MLLLSVQKSARTGESDMMQDIGYNVVIWFRQILSLVNNNWLLRSAFVCGFVMFCLDLIFTKRDGDK